MNGIGALVAIVIGGIVTWAFLYYCIYFAVKAAIRDAKHPRFDPETDDHPLVAGEHGPG